MVAPTLLDDTDEDSDSATSSSNAMLATQVKKQNADGSLLHMNDSAHRSPSAKTDNANGTVANEPLISKMQQQGFSAKKLETCVSVRFFFVL